MLLFVAFQANHTSTIDVPGIAAELWVALIDATECGRFGARPRLGSGQVAIGPFLDQGRVSQNTIGTFGQRDLALGKPVGDGGGSDPVLLEDLGVAVLDDNAGTGQGGELA